MRGSTGVTTGQIARPKVGVVPGATFSMVASGRPARGPLAYSAREMAGGRMSLVMRLARV